PCYSYAQLAYLPSLPTRRSSDLLGPDTDRSAHFICTLALAWPDGHTEVFEGRANGNLVWPPRGTLGFGYDPVFQPEGFEQTFAELDPQHKHEMSHRADAFNKLVKACFD